MRRLMLASVIATMALTMLPASADTQSFQGSILSPTRFASEPTEPWPGLARQFREATLVNFCDPDLGCHEGPEHDYHQGILGWVFEVNPETWNLPFTIGDVTDLTGMADIDIQFYYDLGSTVWGSTTPSTPPDPGGSASTRAPGGETGIVPDGATYGIMVMPIGLNATFTYSAG